MMAPTDPLQVMDGILQQVMTAPDPVTVAQYLRSLPNKDLRDTALAGPLTSGQDPLTVLHFTQNTVVVFYILVARLTVNGAQPPPQDIIVEFTRRFDSDQARLVPQHVTSLARGISRYATHLQNPRWAITPLFHLLTRYPPDAGYLTTIHPIFTLTCLQAKHPTAALPVLNTPITTIDTTLNDLHYNDNLSYHYTGGVALAMLKKWNEAEEFFEIAVTTPGVTPAALQMEALKKLRLVQLIYRGKVSPLPKYTHPLLTRQFKSTPYQTFINAYPHNVEVLKDILHKERNTFSNENNVGLLRQAIDRAPRWALKKLTATYLSLNLADIGKAVKIDSQDEVRGVLLSMIEDGDISATIAADGSVTFSDPPLQIDRAQVDQMLRDVQIQSNFLEYLEKEMAKSKEYLSKAVKGKDDSGPMGGGNWAAHTADPEDMFTNLGPSSGMWAEEASFS